MPCGCGYTGYCPFKNRTGGLYSENPQISVSKMPDYNKEVCQVDRKSIQLFVYASGQQQAKDRYSKTNFSLFFRNNRGSV